MKRIIAALSLGTCIAYGLFYLMSSLIAMDGEYKKPQQDSMAIEFLRLKKDDNLESRRRQLPKKPPLPKDPPKIEKLNVVQQEAPQTPQMQMDMPKLANNLSLGDGPYLGGAQAGAGDGQVMPLVRIEPQYPRKAAMQGLEGWVVLEFDITQAGTVDNVKILEANPTRVFDSAARRALLKWKYKPKTIDGQAVEQRGNRVKLDFKLEG